MLHGKMWQGPGHMWSQLLQHQLSSTTDAGCGNNSLQGRFMTGCSTAMWATVMWVMWSKWLTCYCHVSHVTTIIDLAGLSHQESCHFMSSLWLTWSLSFVTIRCYSTRIEFYSCESGCWLLSPSYESKWIKLTMTRRVYTRVVTRGCKTGSIGRHGVILTVEI